MEEAQREESGTEKERGSGRGGKLVRGGPGLGCRFREG